MASSSSSPSTTKNAAVESYIGSYISLISKYEIRYEGILHQLNVHDSTIALKNVRSYGTEGRKKDGPQIPSSDKVYEFILFRGSDIKDLQVKTAPPVSKEEPIHDDPAIIQSHYAGDSLSSSASASIDHEPFAASARREDVPALISGAYSPSWPSSQFANNVESTNVSQNPAQSFSMPGNWQQYTGTSINNSYVPQNSIPPQPVPSASPSLLVQNQIQSPVLEDSPIMGLTSASEFVTPAPEFVTPALSASSNLSHAIFSTFSPVPHSICQEIPPSYPKTSLQSHAAYNSVDRVTNISFPFSNKISGFTNVQSFSRDASDPIQSYGPVSHGLSQCLASDSGPLLTPISSLLTPNQLIQPTSHVNSSMLYTDQKKMDLLAPLSSALPSSISTSGSQAPLLPLPSPGQAELKQSTIPFTEEFDFEAMNEKFKKDEVWGYLGKKATDKMAVTFDESLEDNVPPDMVTNFDPKPAYKKNEFFDTISCTSLGRGRNAQNRFSERMKQDTETFGWSNQRPNNMGYGSYGTGRGNNYRGRHNWGRGYGYGGRGNWNMPF